MRLWIMVWVVREPVFPDCVRDRKIGQAQRRAGTVNIAQPSLAQRGGSHFVVPKALKIGVSIGESRYGEGLGVIRSGWRQWLGCLRCRRQVRERDYYQNCCASEGVPHSHPSLPIGLLCGRRRISRWRRRTADNSSAQHAPAVREPDLLSKRVVRSVFGHVPADGQFIARLDGVFPPAIAIQKARSAGLDAPPREAAIIALYVQRDVAVGIDHFTPHYGS